MKPLAKLQLKSNALRRGKVASRDIALADHEKIRAFFRSVPKSIIYCLPIRDQMGTTRHVTLSR